MPTAAIIVLVWTASLALFCIGHARWCARMEAYDKSTGDVE
jgi:hypothetical protein